MPGLRLPVDQLRRDSATPTSRSRRSHSAPGSPTRAVSSASRPRPAPAPPSTPGSTSSTPPTSTAPAPPRRPGARSSPTMTATPTSSRPRSTSRCRSPTAGSRPSRSQSRSTPRCSRLRTDYVDLYQCHRFDIDDADRGDDGGADRGRSSPARRATSASASGRRSRSGAALEVAGRGQVRLLPAAVQHDLARARGRGLRALRRATASRRSSGRRSPRACSPASTTPGEPPPSGSRAASDEMSDFAIERYIERRGARGGRSGCARSPTRRGLSMVAARAGLDPAPRARSPRRSSAPRGPSRCTTTPRPPAVELSDDTLAAIDEALAGHTIEGQRLGNNASEGVLHR